MASGKGDKDQKSPAKTGGASPAKLPAGNQIPSGSPCLVGVEILKGKKGKKEQLLHLISLCNVNVNVNILRDLTLP